MRRLLTRTLLAASLVLVLAPAAAADPPTVVSFEETFDDENPCTGQDHTVTVTGEFLEHFHGERHVAHGELTITTTPTGFVGHGTTTNVENGQLVVFHQTEILSNDAGDRIRALVVVVLDLSTDTVRVERFDRTCLSA
jgi:hypothetical protein